MTLEDHWVSIFISEKCLPFRDPKIHCFQFTATGTTGTLTMNTDGQQSITNE